MKNIFKTGLLLLCAVGLLSACEDDNDSNPTLVTPTTFHLNTPAISDNNVVDVAHSSYLNFTCDQPDFGGFPIQTQYSMQMSLSPDMSNAVTLATNDPYSTNLQVIGNEVASNLTSMEVAQGKTEADFPMTIPVYFRAVANAYNTATKQAIDTIQVLSNVVSLKNVYLPFSLPAMTAPENIYLTGGFNGWDWGNALKMVEVYGTRDNENTTVKFWHMVYIDGSGIKFNTATAWDGNEVGFSGITVDPESELGSEIQASSDGNISSSNPGWYLMIVNAKVNGRKIDYTVTFNKPNVYLMGLGLTSLGVATDKVWDEGTAMAASAFTVPTTADGEFVSPALPTLAGTEADGCVRVWVKIPGYDWWKSEFIVGLDGQNISYRGNGGDQDRVGSTAGQQVHLNFTKETGEIK